jgi:adenylosuccinate lyase
MFLATDAVLLLMANISSGLEVHPAVIERRLQAELPFMATEQLIVRAVHAGGDRQVVHETIRKHSLAAASAMKNGADSNDLLDRLAKDKSFGVKLKDLEGVIDPKRFVGRAPEQVDEFLRDVITPIFAGETAKPRRPDELRV